MRKFGGPNLPRSWRGLVAAAIVVAMAHLAAGCSDGRSSGPDSRVDAGSVSQPTPTATRGAGAADAAADVVLDLEATGSPIDRRVIGTNVPAWLGPDTLASSWFRDAVLASGVTTLRFPGGSWSNYYDWSGCEIGDPGRCFWTWAARPSDFVDLMSGTGLEGMWTVNVNGTAESAAAAVAFFNGDVDDDHVIGIDRHGVDWETTGRWARLRAAGGHPEPADIELWEVGNEVFGGTPDAGGDECAPFGWEGVWTCDGREYVIGNDDHDGYLAIRDAMRQVDDSISVGAVGVAEPESWSNWGNEVIDGAAGALDFYVVHQYGFDGSPAAAEALDRPGELWPSVIAAARSRLPDDVPLAITEYNLVSFEAGDTERSMTKAVNALYVADTIGQFVVNGVEIANQWNMANGTTGSGTDYGLIDASDGSPFPQFEAVRLWGRTGDELIASASHRDLDELRVYPTRHRDGKLSVIVLNLGDRADSLVLELAGRGAAGDASLETHRATDPSSDTLVSDRSVPVADSGDRIRIDLPAWSMSLLEVDSR